MYFIRGLSVQAGVRRFACRSSDTWPSWSASMVGIGATAAFAAQAGAGVPKEMPTKSGMRRGGSCRSALAGVRLIADVGVGALDS
jgi:hypothetical protein